MRPIAFAGLLAACGPTELASTLAPVGEGVATTPAVLRSIWDEPLPPSSPLPPISGGSLLVTSSGAIAAGDPDYDAVWIVDGELITRVQLPFGVEVGRMTEDGARRLHVVLRRAGEIATIDLAAASPALAFHRPVCAEPRGITWRRTDDVLLVACETGELVTLPAAGGPPLEVRPVGGDLRDVFVDGDDVVVSRFRSAEIIRLGAGGETVTRIPTATFVGSPLDGGMRTLAAGLAWRTLPGPDGGLIVVHQRSNIGVLELSDAGVIPLPDGGVMFRLPDGGATFGHDGNSYGGLGGDCSPAVTGPAVTLIASDGMITTRHLSGALPVDAVFDPAGADGGSVHVALATFGLVMDVGLGLDSLAPAGPCNGQLFQAFFGPPGSAVGVALSPALGMVTLLRSPPRLVIGPERRIIALPVDAVRSDPGRDLFHQLTPSGLACASCHPEGREDGRVWNFQPGGARRTQSLAGGILSTAPFHWDGAFRSFEELLDEVLTQRMAGFSTPEGRAALARWVDSIALPRPRGTPSASADRGAELFFDPAVGCASCHAGPRFTNNQNADVGTGGALQVPSLIGVGARAPYMHDGCARTLEERFDPSCGGSKHGATGALPADAIADLVAYLRTL